MDSSNGLVEIKSTVQSPDLNKVFGVIKRECIVLNVTEPNVNFNDVLKPGTLIQIVTDYPAEGTYFKMRDFINWLDKYKTTIYKCAKDDYIMVTMELWPYLVTVKNSETRIQFVQNVYNQEFNLDMLRLDRLICIRSSTDSNGKNYNFIVTYNGPVKEKGAGYYIGLMLMNDQSLASELKYWSKYYRFGGLGIVVSADWIMLNLYTETTKGSYPPVPQHETNSSAHMSTNEIAFGASEFNFENDRKTQIKKPEKLNEMDAIPKTSHRSAINENQIDRGAIKNSEITECDLCDKTVKMNCGVILRECLHSYCMQCIRNYVKSNSKNSKIKCPYKKLYKCTSFLWDTEIKDLCENSIYESILNNRLKELTVNGSTSGICPNENCNFIWPHKSKNIVQCPKCFCSIVCSCTQCPHISSRQKHNRNELGKMRKMKCSNKADVLLSLCNHSFCSICIYHLIEAQIYNTNNMSIDCAVCKNRITFTDISRYGNMELLAKLQARIESEKYGFSRLRNSSRMGKKF